MYLGKRLGRGSARGFARAPCVAGICALFVAMATMFVQAAEPRVVVIDETVSLQTLKKQSDKAARKAYALYSKLNQDDDFDIKCTRDETTGSRVSSYKCQPRYYGSLQTLFAGDSVTERGFTEIPMATLRKYEDQLREHIEAAMAKSDELRDAMAEYHALRNALQARLAAAQ